MKDIELICGDCLEILPTIKDNSIDLILVDLPYEILNIKWDNTISLDWDELKRITTDQANFLFFGVQPFTSDLINSNREMFRYNVIWVKNRPTLGHHSKNRPMRLYEEISIFSKLKWGHESQLKNNRMTYNPQGLKYVGTALYDGKMSKNHTGARPNQVGKEYEVYTNYPNDVLYYNSVNGAVHPTQKPIDLLERLIKTYSNEGDRVIDFTMGSGSTGVACKNTNRKFVGIELNEEYFNIAKERINVNTLF